MADDRDDSQRTEEPTQRRLDEAHRKGDVVKSAELSLARPARQRACSRSPCSARSSVQRFAAEFRVFLENPGDMVIDPGTRVRAARSTRPTACSRCSRRRSGLMVFAALAGNVVQHRPVFSAARLKPEFSKLSPMKGFKRLFGLDGLMNFVKGIAKILLVGGACVWAVWPELGRVAAALDLSPAGIDRAWRSPSSSRPCSPRLPCSP